MPNSSNVTRADGAGLILQKYYTARTINATASSRAYANFDLQVGDLVVLDPYSNATGREGMPAGAVVAVPTASNLHLPHYVVTAVHPDVNTGVQPTSAINNAGADTGTAVNPRSGGWIDVMALGVAPCAVLGANIAVGDLLAITPATPSNGLVGRATLQELVTTALAVTSTAAAVTTIAATKAVALETYASGSVVGTIRCAFGPIGSHAL